MGATQFALLFLLGLREEHALLDVGCGSLRAGRLVMQLLLPARYVGIEPNTHLWQDAIANEIGDDFARIKAPRFVEDDTFSLDATGQKFDFVMFQSIFSHTGGDLFDRPLEQTQKVLTDDGQMLFTVIDESCQGFAQLQPGNEAPGWHYPQCVSFAEADVLERCARAGLHAQKLPWFHPRQSWYRAVADPACLLSEGDIAGMGTGRPLIDDRFA